MIDTTPATISPRQAARRVTLCAEVSRASGEDPAGSAWASRRYLLVELPLPWTANVLESPKAPGGLTALLTEVWDRLPTPWGFIGIAPDASYSVPGMAWILDMRQGDDLAAPYRAERYLVPAHELVDHLRLLSFDPDSAALDIARQPHDPDTSDWLVCTHGAVDACCATLGFPLYRMMRSMADTAATPTRVWRCTHFGGHRFAATTLEMPAGRYWGHLEVTHLGELMSRRGDTRALRPHYRGWAALADPLWQIAEAALLATAGWGWTDATVTGITGEATPERGGTLTVRWRHPVAGAGSAVVDLVPLGSIRSTHTSATAGDEPELFDAPQYRATVRAQVPAGCLDAIVSDG